MELKNENLFWKKKEFVSFVLSILVFFIHMYFAEDITSDSFISILNHKTAFFLCRSITRFAVPMFFILSGITFFKEYNNSKYITKIKSRMFTLVIPYLLWNTIWLLKELLGSYTFLSRFSNGEQYPITLTSILKGIFFYSCNIPFWFVFDLIIFTLAAPLIFLLIKNKYIGITLVVGLSVLSCFGIHLPESLFYYPTSIVFFMIGALIGYHNFDFVCYKSSELTQIISVVFLTSYVFAKTIVPQELFIQNYLIEIIVYTVSAFSLWNIVDIFIGRIKPRKVYSRSFAIYAMHLNIAIIIQKIILLLLPESEWLKIPEFIVTVALTLIIINIVCAFLERFLPKVYALLFGGRIRKNNRSESVL